MNEKQITVILEGPHVIASPREMQEVKNAIVAYDRLDEWKPNAQSDQSEPLKEIHMDDGS